MAPLPALHRPGQPEPVRIAVPRPCLDPGTAGITEPQHLGDLVERLADGVIDGGAEAPVGADAFDRQQLAMAARHQEQEVGKFQIVGEPRGKRVPLQMVHRQERQAVHRGDGLAGHDADDDAADQSGPAGRRDPVEVGPMGARLRHGPPDQPIQVLQVGPRRDLGDDAAEWTVLVDLRFDDIASDSRRSRARRIVDDRRRSLVAAGFDAQNYHCSRAVCRFLDANNPLWPSAPEIQ